MAAQLTGKDRLTRQILGQEVDRIPTIGGWIGAAQTLADLAGVPLADYLADPGQTAVRAHRALGVDGSVGMIYFKTADEVRAGHILEQSFEGVEPEDLVRHANDLPDSDAGLLKDFDAPAAEAQYRAFFENNRRWFQTFEPVPNFWDLGGHFPLYAQFGYVAFLTACAEYPEAVGKIWHARSLVSREKAKILARLYREMDLVPMLFCGEDLCNNHGPMVSPEFLRRWYFPTVKMILEPIVETGVRVIHHCDGDVRPLADDFLSLGFSGFQGFQFELGIDLAEMAAKKDALGRPVLLMASLSVTGVLPYGSPQDVANEVDRMFLATDLGRRMLLFTTNVTTPDISAANLLAGYRRAQQLTPGWPIG